MAWALSIDVGTTATAAATSIDGHHQVVELDGRSRMPSTVLAPPAGPLVVGEAAEAQAALDPARVERTPKRRLGDPVMLLGDRAVDPVDAVASILEHVATAAARPMGGTAPDRLVLTHPARWGRARLDQLRDAAQRARLPEPALVPEPVAAAALLALDLAAVGDLLAVYDLGGGTLDVAIVRRTTDGFEVAGPPGGDEDLGGEALDGLVVDEVRRGLDPAVVDALTRSSERPWLQAHAELRRSARVAKEVLSSAQSHRWYLGVPIDAEVSLTAERLEALIGEPVEASVRSLLDTLSRAGLRPDHLRTVVMVGGGARVPLVARTLERAIGRPPTTWGDPKAAVSLGALVVTAPPASGVGPPPPAPTPSVVAPPAPVDPGAEQVPLPADVEPRRDPEPLLAPPPAEAPGMAPPPDPPESEAEWDRSRIGMTVAVGLVALGVVFALLALLVL